MDIVFRLHSVHSLIKLHYLQSNDFYTLSQRFEVWNRGRSISIVAQKYTAYDHFQGTGSYGEKILAEYEQIRTLSLALGLPCHNW